MNRAAWIPSRRADLDVGPAPYPTAGEGQIVVRNHAVAINPLDWIKQLLGDVMYGWIRYPFVLGSDLAGEVVEVGPGVTRFAVGDRVLAHALGMEKKRNSAAEGAFQEHSVVLAHMAAPIPSTLSYEKAAVLPLGLSTAACALFQQDQLGLAPPSADPVPVGRTVLVWGGSTSVGSNAIQLAVAAGYDVVTTASPRNADYVTGLGASQVFDYRSPTVVEDLVRALADRTVAGALAVGQGSARPCCDVVHATDGAKVVVMASPAVSFATLPRRPGPRSLVPMLARLVSSQVALQVRARTRRIRTPFVIGSTLMDNEVSTLVYTDFLPAALAEGRYLAAPEPLVVGRGLEAVQAGLDAHRAGVSARKVVVTL